MMVLNCGATSHQCQPMRLRMVCSSSPSTTAQQLRLQLDSLHSEAESTRTKATNARLRLIRLSEAAEKLRRQASVSIQTGKENDARDLLFQKKNVIQAMEKLKNRIELFDELSAKLNEAITMKEGLLVGNMALDLAVSEIETPSPVIIVSHPIEEITNNSVDDQPQFIPNDLKCKDDQEEELLVDSQSYVNEDNEGDNQEVAYHRKRFEDAEKSPTNSPYEDFMQKLDEDLNKIEKELEAFIRFSNLLLDRREKPEYSKVQQLLDRREKPEYSKVQQVTEILDGVRQTRKRILKTMQTTCFGEPY